MSIYDIGLEPPAANHVARSPVSVVERSVQKFAPRERAASGPGHD